MRNNHLNISIIGAGTIGTALGNIIAETEIHRVKLLSIEEQVVNSINSEGINTKYFPTIHLHPSLKATTETEQIKDSDIIFLAIPSAVLMDYMTSILSDVPVAAILVNLAKGFGSEHKTIIHCLKESFPNPLCSMKGPSFALTGFPPVLPLAVRIGQSATNFMMSSMELPFSSTDRRT